MQIGMAVNVPKTQAEKDNLAKLIKTLDDAMLPALKAGLYIQGVPGSDFLGTLTDQLMRTWRNSK